MVITSEYEGVYSLKQLENHRMTDDEFYAFCLLNDPIKFERDAFGNIIIKPNSGGILGIIKAELNANLGIWNRKNKLGKLLIHQRLSGYRVRRCVPLMPLGFQMNDGMF